MKVLGSRIEQMAVSVFLSAAMVAGMPIPSDAQQRVRIGSQTPWATVGEIYETLAHTNILELNGITGDFKRFTYGGPLGEAAVAGEVD
ncbi:MAG: hypothetical protein ACRDGM_11120, partial [bacterium]